MRLPNLQPEPTEEVADDRDPGQSPVVRSAAQDRSERNARLERQYPIAECRDLLVLRQLVAVGDPPSRQAHQPLHERRCRAWDVGVVHEHWRWRGTSGDVFPAGDGVGVASPALNSPSIRVHSVSDSALLLGEPAGPCSANSMIW
jgi:hypothetical protein